MDYDISKAGEGEGAAAAAVEAAAFQSVRDVYRPAPGAAASRPKVQRTRIVARHQGQIVGTVRFSVEDDSRLHLVGLAVDPACRRRGVARRIIEYLAAMAVERHLRCLSLYTICETGNVPVFERLGFKVVRVAPAEGLESDRFPSLSEAYMERQVTSLPDA